MMAALIIHADDYGITPAQSRDILDCSSACGGSGVLNSLSVLVGSPHAGECAELLSPHLDDILVGLHVNLVEGRCCADPKRIPLLVDSAGMFRQSFAGLLVQSVRNPMDFRRQVACEVAAQLEEFFRLYPTLRRRLRVDSHQHFHLIPAVFDAVILAVAEADCHLEYLRIPAEPTRPFLRSPEAVRAVTPVNWVKHFLLDALWVANRHKVPGLGDASGVFCGVAYSGAMTAEHVGLVVDAYRRSAAAQGRPLEILFHPGGLKDPADCLNPQLEGFVAFYASPGRTAERHALQSATWLA